MNFKNPKIPNVPTRGATTLLKVALFGGAAAYAALNSLYNVDGGHRAIVFNRIQGIKDKVSLSIFLSDLFFFF
jgi:prohibitin 2